MITTDKQPAGKTEAASLTGGRSLLVLGADDVAAVLRGRDREVISAVEDAYCAHVRGETSLPHSAFVYLPGAGNRIIALPAYLGEPVDVAGVKWISSVPGNIERGLDRASAVVILNSVETGRPKAVLEGSLISARRTSASAISAARVLHPNPQRIALVGCGLLNFEIARLAASVFPALDEFILYDLDAERSIFLAGELRQTPGASVIRVAGSIEEACGAATLVSFATTAGSPYVSDPEMFRQCATILHISLRDLSPEVILKFDNVVDDADHVCRANTSLDLAAKIKGDRSFIRCSLGEILLEQAPARKDATTPVIFSPFGLGILDLAVANLVYEAALSSGFGVTVPSFCKSAWRA